MSATNPPIPLTWSPDSSPHELTGMLQSLTTIGMIRKVYSENADLRYERASNEVMPQTRRNAATWEIYYDSIRTAARGTGLALAGLEGKTSASFQTMAVMIDCSRNAVMRVDCLKRWLNKLALLGFNQLMLYTEDTYQLPDEPFFGYMRGAYSANEIREIDDAATALGIEVVACIQTLGHAEQILKWPAYRSIMDTERVLRVDRAETYTLIDKMIAFWSENLRSRRIHVGMDEAVDLGRGTVFDSAGWHPPFDLFVGHLKALATQCDKAGLRPMIWSDMFFRIASKTRNYYDQEAVIPSDVHAAVPPGMDLVYWDYYSRDPDFYREWIRRHKAFGRTPIVASGIWTWGRFWYDDQTTEAALLPCVQACRDEGVNEMIFTLWGDGGSYCEFDSAWAGLVLAADQCHGGSADHATLTAQTESLGVGALQDLQIGSALHLEFDHNVQPLKTSTVIWDDPLLGIGWQGRLAEGPEFWTQVITHYQTLKIKLEPLKERTGTPDYAYLYAVTDVILRKLEFRMALTVAYQNRNRTALQHLLEHEIPGVLAALEMLQIAFRRQWLRRNKSIGMEGTQIRIGTGVTRYQETARKLRDLLNGQITEIEELEIAPTNLPLNAVDYYVRLSTGSNII